MDCTNTLSIVKCYQKSFSIKYQQDERGSAVGECLDSWITSVQHTFPSYYTSILCCFLRYFSSATFMRYMTPLVSICPST